MRWIERHDPTGTGRLPMRLRSRAVLGAMFAIASLAVTLAGFFSPDVPFWIAGLPLAAAIVIGTPDARAIAMAAWMFWPAVIIVDGLGGVGALPDMPAWPAALLAAVILGGLAALAGITTPVLFLVLIPVSPASPLLVIADAVPGTGLAGLLLAVCGFMMAEALPGTALRTVAVCLIMAGAGGLSAPFDASFAASRAQAPPTAWQSVPVPLTVTERTRWIVLRDSIAHGSRVVMGENIFHASDREAAAFWCDAARTRDLTLWIGVYADDGMPRRGEIWRFDRDTCAGPQPHPQPVYAARFGVPGITGTWGPMEPVAGGNAGPHWFICLEAFLPVAWLMLPATANPSYRPAVPSGASYRPAVPSGASYRPAVPSGQDRPVIVLANDTPVDALPVAILRRKVARAMGGLHGRIVLFAETGHSILVAKPAGDSP